jgi:hypothetical protein
MPRIQSKVAHQLGATEARSRVQNLLELVQKQYGDMVQDLQGRWEADTLIVSFRAYGFNIDSNVTIEETVVAVDGNIPMTAYPFRGKIQETIVGKLEEILST